MVTFLKVPGKHDSASLLRRRTSLNPRATSVAIGFFIMSLKDQIFFQGEDLKSNGFVMLIVCQVPQNVFFFHEQKL